MDYHLVLTTEPGPMTARARFLVQLVDYFAALMFAVWVQVPVMEPGNA